MGIVVRIEQNSPGHDPVVEEEKFTVRKFKQWNPDRQLLQFYAVSGGLRTVHSSDIIRIGKPVAGEAKFVGLSTAECAAMGEVERSNAKRRKEKRETRGTKVN
jgi:hypothetical protein